MRTLAGPWAASPAAASTCYPLTGRTVRLAALVLPFALCPAVVAAQASTQYPAQQGTAAPSVAASQPSTSSERSEDRPGRLLVVDCPVHGTSDATSPSDADSTTNAVPRPASGAASPRILDGVSAGSPRNR